MVDEERIKDLETEFSAKNRDLDKESPRVEAIVESVATTDTVLDVGCVAHSATLEQSDLWLHGRLEQKAGEVLGIDYAEDEIEKLRERGYNVKTADAESFELGEQYDKVVAGEIIEHLPNPGQFLRNAREHLKDEGTLILSTPNPWTIDRISGAILVGGISPNPDHVCWYDKSTIETQLEKQELETIDISFYEPPKPKATLSYRFFRNTVLRIMNRVGFSMLGGPEMVVRAGKKH